MPQNILTKYVQPGWVLAAARSAEQAGASTARVHCRWQQTSVATGRLSCADPNLQVGDDWLMSIKVTAERRQSPLTICIFLFLWNSFLCRDIQQTKPD